MKTLNRCPCKSTAAQYFPKGGKLENSSEYYFEKLKSSTNPGAILSAMYCTLYDKEPSRADIIMCNRLIKVFGRFTTFFSIIDMAGSYPELPTNPYPLLYTICKRRFEVSHIDSNINARESLEGYISDMQKEIEKVKKQKITIPMLEEREQDVRQ